MARDAQDDLRITDQFDLEVFWAEYGKQITTALVVIVVVGLGILFWQYQTSSRAEQAAQSLAQARDVMGLEQVVRDYPGSQTAADALFRLGDAYYSGGQYAQAASTYQKIINDYSSYPLAASARLSLAQVAEAQGNVDSAVQQYLQIVNSGQPPYLVYGAKISLARCYEAQGKKKEAAQLYEEVLAG